MVDKNVFFATANDETSEYPKWMDIENLDSEKETALIIESQVEDFRCESLRTAFCVPITVLPQLRDKLKEIVKVSNKRNCFVEWDSSGFSYYIGCFSVLSDDSSTVRKNVKCSICEGCYSGDENRVFLESSNPSEDWETFGQIDAHLRCLCKIDDYIDKVLENYCEDALLYTF